MRRTPYALAALIVSLLIAPEPGHAQPSCGQLANPIACENALPGQSGQRVGRHRRGRREHPGLRHRHQRQPRRQTVRFKIKTHRDQLPPRHLPAGLLRRARARARSRRCSPRRRCRRPSRACLTDAATGLDRLRQLGRVGVLGRARRTPSPASTSPGSSATDDRRRQPHRLRRARRRRRLRPALPDLGHDLAGLQPLRRQQPLHAARPAGRAYKVSYNRPFTRATATAAEDWVFNAEYPMVRWLERNGYDVSYFTGVDTDRRGARAPRTTRSSSRSATTSTGRAQQRANVEAARDAGVHLAFFSGNEVFWKTRWEPSIDGAARRTARSSPTRRRTPTRRSIPTPDVDRHLARPALQPARRRRPARERADRHALHGQRRRARRRSRCPPPTASCASGATPSVATLGAGPDRPRCPPARSATSGTRTSTTASGPPA